ncbi:MAG TPA: hypothetical protein VFN25_12170 [Dokdonella sp.]|uniref:ATP-grasp domain-containing protein n=1 Tax=Dokdonella sp. TaxID=2291710 RepID=UPI002D7FA547|nr:hypothetical protein [Dokdonella sp.]HET9033646.1 hypothetical protein [Dokdonella sp.]
MPHVALVTAQAARATDEDLAPLESALRDSGAQVSIVDWDDAKIDWSQFDLTVLRSCWDYTARYVEFLIWAERISQQTRLVNRFEIVRWNTDKHYLAELQRAGIAIVPSQFVEPGSDVPAELRLFLDKHGDCAELVVKPVIGAGSMDTQRYTREDSDSAIAHIERLLKAGRSVLLQPYLDRVDEAGETALIHFDGEYSHSIRKGPMLRHREDATNGLYHAEQIDPREADVSERALAIRVLAALPFDDALAYARVDLIRATDGTPALLELELAEPSLFFRHAPGSAKRFAATLLKRIDKDALI